MNRYSAIRLAIAGITLSFAGLCTVGCADVDPSQDGVESTENSLSSACYTELRKENELSSTCQEGDQDYFCLAPGGTHQTPLDVSTCASIATAQGGVHTGWNGPLLTVWVQDLTHDRTLTGGDSSKYSLSIVDATTGAPILENHLNYTVDMTKIPAGTKWRVDFKRKGSGPSSVDFRINMFNYDTYMCDQSGSKPTLFGTSKLYCCAWPDSSCTY